MHSIISSHDSLTVETKTQANRVKRELAELYLGPNCERIVRGNVRIQTQNILRQVVCIQLSA